MSEKYRERAPKMYMVATLLETPGILKSSWKHLEKGKYSGTITVIRLSDLLYISVV